VSGTGSTDNTNFTIVNNELKANAIFQYSSKSSYSIRIRVTDAGGLRFEKSIIITVIADKDSDGVRDEIDLCPNTVSGTTVDFNGCELFILGSNNYTVFTTATSCIGQQNGAISVSANNSNYSYNVTVNGQTGFDLNSTNNFKNQIQNLAPGDYEICISIVGKTNYLQCYNLKVTEPKPLSATNKLSSNGKQVTYNLSGASTYLVTLNGTTQTYTSNEITLDLVPGQNTISFATDLYCQGKIEDSIFKSENLVFFPNPVKENLTIYCEGTDTIVRVRIIDLSDKTSDDFLQTLPENRLIELNLASYPTGIYLVRLEGKTVNETIKVIKQ
jgi:hypothetical protein